MIRDERVIEERKRLRRDRRAPAQVAARRHLRKIKRLQHRQRGTAAHLDVYASPVRLGARIVRAYGFTIYVPFLTSKDPTRYAIVNAPGPNDTVLRVEPLPAAWWQASDRIYVVERQPAR